MVYYNPFLKSCEFNTLRFLYTSLLYLLTPIILLRLLWRSVRLPAYRRRWAERFGFCHLPQQGYLWIHAVSVGEVQATLPLVRYLQQQYSHHPLLITTMTPTGAERVRTLFGDQVTHTYLPYDLPGAVNRFLYRVQPVLLILMETEVWPNLLHACRHQTIPVILANARLSARSARGYQYIQRLIQPALMNISTIAAQTQDDADRFLSLGIPPNQVKVTGNLKFDQPLPDNLDMQAQALRTQWENRPVWIAASTHEGEEALVLAAFQMIKQQVPNCLLILVPRHPDRFAKVAALCHAHTVVKRSDSSQIMPNTDIYLGDTMGELLLLYASADVAFVGGSLVPVGGHNLLEPATLSLPIVTGPHTFNFADITTKLVNMGAAIQIKNSSELANTINRCLKNPELRQQMGSLGQQMVQQNQGALQKLANIIKCIIN